MCSFHEKVTTQTDPFLCTQPKHDLINQLPHFPTSISILYRDTSFLPSRYLISSSSRHLLHPGLQGKKKHKYHAGNPRNFPRSGMKQKAKNREISRNNTPVIGKLSLEANFPSGWRHLGR
jgi:hypothetical protein